jgi:hypothetical protein
MKTSSKDSRSANLTRRGSTLVFIWMGGCVGSTSDVVNFETKILRMSSIELRIVDH